MLENVNTIILLRELDNRLHLWKNNQGDSFFSSMAQLSEQSLVDLDSAMSNVLTIFSDDIVEKVANNQG